jgi:cytochrome c peroxidase
MEVGVNRRGSSINTLKKKKEEEQMKVFVTALICIVMVGLFIMAAMAAGDAARGKILFNDPKLAGGTAGISCNTCHPNGKGLEKAGDRSDLAQFINTCLVNANKGKPLDPKSADMADLIAYIKSLKTK